MANMHLPSSTAVRIQVESALALKFPSALTPPARNIRSSVATGIAPLDELLNGGLPVGAITELIGEPCSGRMSLALSFLAQVTAAEKICAWIDASNTFNPVAAAAVGVDLGRLLWVRCGMGELTTQQETRRFGFPSECFRSKPGMNDIPAGDHGTHPNLLLGSVPARSPRRAHVFNAIEQALKTADLLIQTGGFSAIVLDLGEIASEVVTRIDLSIWHRYRVAAEQTQASIVLLSQYPCTKSSSELQLRLSSMEDRRDERTVFIGMSTCVEVMRHRFAQARSNVVPIRKTPHHEWKACWTNRTSWVGPI